MSIAKLAVSGSQIIETLTGAPIDLRGVNWGRWGSVQPNDAADAKSGGANCVRLPLRWFGDYGQAGVDSRLDGAPGHINPANLAILDATIAQASAQGLYIILFLDSDCGQNGLQPGEPEYCDPNGVYPNGRNFWRDLGLRQLFIEVWQFVANRYKNTPYLGMYEVLPEPGPIGVSDADITAFQVQVMDAVRQIDPVTPFLIGPSGGGKNAGNGYNINRVAVSYIPGRKDIVYTGNLFVQTGAGDIPTIKSNTQARLQSLIDFRAARNVPVFVQQTGVKAGEDPTNVLLPFALNLLIQANIGFTIWQYRDGTGANGYAPFYALSDDANPLYAVKSTVLSTWTQALTQATPARDVSYAQAFLTFANATHQYLYMTTDGTDQVPIPILTPAQMATGSPSGVLAYIGGSVILPDGTAYTGGGGGGGGGGDAQWGDIGGLLENQADLKGALDAKTTPSAVATQITTALVPYSTTDQTNTALNNALAAYSTTTQSNTALSTALQPYAKSSDVNGALADKLDKSAVGAPSGAASLTSLSKVPLNQLPPEVLGNMAYATAWDATANSPLLTDAAHTKGRVYTVSVAGTTTLGGINVWAVGDHLVDNGTTWEKWAGPALGAAGAVTSVVGQTNAVTLAQLVAGGVAPLASPALTGTPTATTAGADTNTTQVATTAFVQGQLSSVTTPLVDGTATIGTSPRSARADHIHPSDTSRAALASPTFTGVPKSTTPAADTNTTQIATTAYVIGQLSATAPLSDGTAAVGTSLRGARADHVHPSDTTRAGLASPAFTGAPTTTTAAVDTNTTQIASTAFVIAQASATLPVMDTPLGAIGVTFRYARSDHAHPSDNAKAPIDSPGFTGTPTAPTPTAGDSTGNIATTSFVTSANALKAPIASPTFTGTPAAPTAVAGTNTTQVATTAFVFAGLSLKASLASPAFTGTPTAPTQAAGDNSTKIATTAFVAAAVAGGGGGGGAGSVTSVNLVTPTSGNVAIDVTNIPGAAPLASPTFTGTVTIPTPAADTNTTAAASTAFVLAQTSATAPVMDGTATPGASTRFARSDHVHPSDTTRAPLASPALTGTPTAPTATTGTNTTQIATTAFVKAVAANGVQSVAGRTGTVTLTTADVSGAAPLDSPTFTTVANAPTPTAGDSSTKIATTAFVTPIVAGKSLRTQAFTRSFFIPDVSDGLMVYIPVGVQETITKIIGKSSSGTTTVTMAINGTNITGTPLAISTTKSSQNYSTGNVANAGADLTLTASSTSAATNVGITVVYTRTLD